MDHNLFLAINGVAGTWHWLDVLGVFFADKFLYVFALIVVLLWLKESLHYYVYIAVGSALVSRLLIVEIIKRLVNHPRPFQIITDAHQLVQEQDSLSFPSGHTVIYFSFAFAFWGTKYFWPFLVLTTLGSLARIFVGVHFPVDIGASIIIAGIVVAVARRLFKRPVLS